MFRAASTCVLAMVLSVAGCAASGYTADESVTYDGMGNVVEYESSATWSSGGGR